MQPSSVFFLLIQLFLSLVFIQIFSPIVEKLKAPKVFAEILAGLLLGPSCFKLIAPEVYSLIFTSNIQSNVAFAAIQELGLLLLMFCSGLEVQLLIKGKERKLALLAGVLGVAIPFGLALGASDYLNLGNLLGANGNLNTLKYFFAICCSITSIPVISRIFMDLLLIQTKFATTCLSIALIEDLILYLIMALTVHFVSTDKAPSYLDLINVSRGSSLDLCLHLLLTLGMFVACFKLFPILILRFKRISFLKKIFSNYLTFSFIILLFVSILCFYLGIPSFLGPFLAGIIVAKTPLQNSEHILHLKKFSFSTFVPLFFVGIGLKIDLVHNFDYFFFMVFILFSSVIKTLGVTASGLVVKMKMKDALNLGFALNARGGPGIVLASIGFGTKLINESFYVTLVLTAIFTSWFAAYWLDLRRSQIELFKH